MQRKWAQIINIFKTMMTAKQTYDEYNDVGHIVLLHILKIWMVWIDAPGLRTKCKFMACFRMITPSVLIAFERSRFVFNTTQNALLKLFKRVHRQMPPTKTIHYSLVCWLADRPVRPSYTWDEWGGWAGEGGREWAWECEHAAHAQTQTTTQPIAGMSVLKVAAFNGDVLEFAHISRYTV